MAMIFVSAVVVACTIAAAVFGGLVPFDASFARAMVLSLAASASLVVTSLAVATLALAASFDG